jgi:tRNA-dihydrouridine synthase
MYTGEADHSLTAELVSLVDVPVVASGDVGSSEKARRVLAETGAAAVMVGRAAQGNPWVLQEIADGDAPAPSQAEVAAELVHFVRETARELGERRASGFLKKFYGWYLRGHFHKRLVQELVRLQTTEEIVRRVLAEAPGARELVDRLEAELPSGEELTLALPISAYGGG